MTLFEYLAIAFSLVLSFSAMRVLAGLSFAATTDRRYWVHLVFVCVQLLVTVLAFWNLWGLRETTWTLPKFVLSLTAPGLIYFNTCTLIPEQASGIDSWRDYYYSVRRRYFIGIAAQTFVVFLIAVVIVGRSVLNPGLAPAANVPTVSRPRGV